MGRVVHFEVNADHPERAAAFYKKVFGWEIVKPMAAYWLVTTGEEGQPGINGGILGRIAPGASTVNTVEVTSVDDTVAQVEAGGGKVVRPKFSVPGVGNVAYCADTEGNLFGIIEPEGSGG